MAQVQPPILPSRLYRYRSLRPDGDALEQEISSIVENYLWCSEFSRMNDPMEGYFRSSKLLRGKRNYDEILKQITSSKSSVGIACFTETNKDVLMWAHYAGNFSGICLSYSTEDLIAGLPSHACLVKLSYIDEPPLILTNHARNAGDAALRILSQKKFNWAYEREWRVLAGLGRTELGLENPLRAIYFGSQVDSQHRHKILLRIQGTGIKAYIMEVDGYEQTWTPINEAAKPKLRRPKKPPSNVKSKSK
jgi:Protein of unknown function (DUF2971)